MRPFDPRLLKYARSTRKYIIFLVITGVIGTLLIGIQTLLIASALEPIFYGKGDLSQTSWLILMLFGVFLLRTALVFIQEAVGHRAALRVIATLRKKVLRHAGDLGARWLSEGNTTRSVTLATRGLDDLEAYFVSFLPQLFLTFTATPALILIIFWLDWISALAIILCIPLIPIFMILIGKMTANYSAQRLKSMQRLGSQLLDLLAGLTTLKAVGREHGPQQRVRALGEAFAQKTMQTLYVAFLSGAALEFLATLSTAIVAVEVGFRMVAGNLLLFEGLVIIMLTPEAFKPLREVGTQFHASANGVAAAAQAFEIIQTPLPTSPAKKSHNAALACTHNAHASLPSEQSENSANHTLPDLRQTAISFQNVSVYADGRATVAPANLSMQIQPGKVTVLRGASGTGKSTTIQVLLGLLPPSAGEIFIGTTPLAEIPQTQWWEQITWVPQRPALFPGTVAENLGIAAPAENAAVLRAAKLTGFAKVVADLPNGWQTLIGQGGIGLSVGQRQRLALTRALLSSRQLVILDEPSAHLDAVAEEAILATISELKETGHTVVIVAHRATLTQLADTVVEVSAGTRNIDAELALRRQKEADQAERERRLQEKIDYALPTAWGREEGATNA
ncbi:thiol reductant ABC exporter subunit CydD [Arcanobacterium hippocoleae]|uniref:thiol reductant ABC exporter subunit CydD n=1 Tax=Arcanobacterium hippocoleae TaxID=149017 RepID=UPI0033418824